MSSGKGKQFEEEMALSCSGFTCTNCAAILKIMLKNRCSGCESKFQTSKVYVKGTTTIEGLKSAGAFGKNSR